MEKLKISLTCITGNCEQDIERFLDAFQPHFDEVVIVRAIGNQEPDRTIEIAKYCGCVTGEYLNGSAGKDWPHVDDFGAARNKALSLATGDWCAWADMDDICENGERIRAIVESANEAGHDMISCPYVVSEQGINDNFRERFWKNGIDQSWVNPIHENLIKKGGWINPSSTTDFKVIHKPGGHKGCTKDRNLRILESVPEDKRTIAHHFYIAQEYLRRDDPKAMASAQAFLANPESSTPERFELIMTMAAKAEDYGTKASLYTAAFGEDPGRAEPLYELAALSLACDQPANALAYAEKMMACKWTDVRCWNHREMFYGFWRDDLYWQCLRVNGQIFLADILRINAAVESGRPTVSLIHATRGRPLQAIQTRTKWLRAATHPERVEHLFVADLEDEESDVLDRFTSYFLKESRGPVAAWNYGASVCHGDVIVQLSDDWEPTKGWDEGIIDAIGDLSKSAVLAVSDGHRKDDLLCMAILTKARLKEQGYFFHPEFFSMYSDNWFSECAFRDGVVIDARDRIVFEHVHPAFGKAEIDETYARSNSQHNYTEGMATLKRLRANANVDAPAHD